MTTQTHLIVGPDESGNVELGEILHRFRDEAKLTRGEAADKIGLSSEYIRLAEVGKRTPALGTVRIMLKVYGIGYHVDKNVVTFDKFEVEFTSRIQEARHKRSKTLPENRDARVGEIIRLMVTADDRTLQHILNTLRTSK